MKCKMGCQLPLCGARYWKVTHATPWNTLPLLLLTIALFLVHRCLSPRHHHRLLHHPMGQSGWTLWWRRPSQFLAHHGGVGLQRWVSEAVWSTDMTNPGSGARVGHGSRRCYSMPAGPLCMASELARQWDAFPLVRLLQNGCRYLIWPLQLIVKVCTMFLPWWPAIAVCR